MKHCNTSDDASAANLASMKVTRPTGLESTVRAVPDSISSPIEREAPNTAVKIPDRNSTTNINDLKHYGFP